MYNKLRSVSAILLLALSRIGHDIEILTDPATFQATDLASGDDPF